MRKDFSFKIDKVKWDFKAVKKRSAEIMATEYKEEIMATVQKKLTALENIIIRKIKDHPVSQEIEDGRNDPLDGANLSGTLNGYGNLWSFIGFFSGDNPMQDIYRTIRGASRVYAPRVYQSVVRVLADIPKLENVYENTPMPWASGRSWAKGISSGISGFGKYLNTDSDTSRSEGGVQGKYKVRDGSYKRTPYLNPIFAAASVEFNRILNETFDITRLK